ncbi:MAG TPA: lysyl oxidase family protein [Gaiellaceae bacterium]
MIAAAVASLALAAEPTGARLLAERSGVVVRVDPAAGGARPLLAGADADWSPDGTQLVVVRHGDLWLANADGSGTRPLTETPDVEETEPDWSPDGATIVYTARIGGRRHIRLLQLPGGATRRIATGGAGEDWSPTFSRDGKRLAFVSTRLGSPAVFVARADGTAPRPFHPAPPPDPATPPPTDVQDLDWSPAGLRLAYTATAADGTRSVVVDDGVTATPVASGDHPVWSPVGSQLAVSSVAADGTRRIVLARDDGSGATGRGAGFPVEWRRVPVGQPEFPDLKQRPPSGLVVTVSPRGRFLLGFTSLVDNRGPGVLWIKASRPPGAPTMDARQLVIVRPDGLRLVRGTGLFLRYTVAPPHYHWHLLGYVRFELRRASDFRLIVRDHKSGFCLADHYGIAPGVSHGPPRFLGSCGQFQPRLRSVEEGTSVGYTDRYPANFHGQNLDLTGVPPGNYWLVHRVNADWGLREERYDNDVASLLIRITWPNGRRSPPRVQTLRTCGASERC